jgi:hypothetical protein
LTRDTPNSDVDLLASRNSLLVRKDLHPALQYLLLEAMREVHWAPGPFNRLGEFPAEQPNDLPLSPTAEAFYRSGPSFWQRYTSFWLTSLLTRIVFFVIPVVAALVPVIGSTFIVSINCTELWETLNANSLIAPTGPGLASIRRDSQKLNPPCGCSRLRAHSKSICTVSGFICAWFKKKLVEWER